MSKNNKRCRPVPLDEIFTINVKPAQIRVDCSLNAYIATDANFLLTLCTCGTDTNGSDYCCQLHHNDFDQFNEAPVSN